MLKKALLAIILFALPYHLFACALCSLYTPSATVGITFEGTPSKIKTIHFRWTFSQDFINILIERYDTNKNRQLDPPELKRVKIILENYIAKKNYLTSIEYMSATSKETVAKKIPIQIKEKTFVQENDTLVFRFTTLVNQAIEPDDEFSFIVKDNEEYFKFLIHTVDFTIDKPFLAETNLYNDAAFVKVLTKESHQSTITPLKPLSVKTIPPQTLTPTQSIQTKASPSSTSWIQSRLAHMQQTIQDAITTLQDKGTFLAYALFLGTSFLYGLLHAAGPGHGKTLVSSYLFASQHRYPKALSMSLAIGIVHTFSAFLLTLIIYALFDLFFNAFFTNVTYYATKLSALIIIAIALYLSWQKIKASRTPLKIISFSAHPFTCKCSSCSPKAQSTEWGVVLSAGIVPCPGTITIFIFALNTGAYLLGFLAALAMSLGMSGIIALTSISTLFTKNRFQHKSPKILIYSEMISLVIMFILGMILLLA